MLIKVMLVVQCKADFEQSGDPSFTRGSEFEEFTCEV